MVRFVEVRADSEDSPVDAGLRFTVKERKVVARLKYETFVDAIDHSACWLAGGVETEVRQHDETVQGSN